MLTSKEVQALDAILNVAIVKAQEEDDGDPVFHEVNFKDVNPFKDARTQSEVYDRLAEKGLILCSGTNVDPFTDEAEEEHVCLTEEGLEALKAAKGVN